MVSAKRTDQCGCFFSHLKEAKQKILPEYIIAIESVENANNIHIDCMHVHFTPLAFTVPPANRR